MRLIAFLLVVCGVVSTSGLQVRAPDRLLPERLLEDVSLLDAPNELRVVASRTSLIYSTRSGESQVNLHSYLTYFEGKFWASWSSAPVNAEDSPSHYVRYSSSTDGHHWEQSTVLVADPDGPDKPGRWYARGIFVHQGKLSALCAYLEGKSATPTPVEWSNLRLVRFEWNGSRWDNRGTYLEKLHEQLPSGVAQQPPADELPR
jgi:hypothetical protein